MSERTENWQGMNWIRQDKRLAIYLRDGCACAWCGASVEQGAQLTLDHLLPVSKGGTNNEANLVTACQRCNSSRGNRSVEQFASAVAQYVDHGVSAVDIAVYVRNRPANLRKFREEAKNLIARRGSAAAVLAASIAATEDV